MKKFETELTRQLNIEYPIICGAMYPCSNPELVAAVSEAGAIGIVQPLSLTYVHGYEFREGLRYIRSLTEKPYGMNVIVERSSKTYEERMDGWITIALEEGCRFFITALGNPDWVVNRVKPYGGIVYHDATERKWAVKALEKGVDGLICVNNRAGGHAGTRSPQELYDELKDLGVPLVCAGGIGDERAFAEALEIGYAGVQMGTRFIATEECHEKSSYKEAIVHAEPKDIVLTERVTGIPLSVIKTPYVEKIGTHAGPIARFFLQNRITKPWMRMWYAFWALRQFKRITQKGGSTRDYWQAGKSVGGVHKVEKAGDIIKRFISYLN
ncbi:MAG: nitronate monooxygenase [Chlamydiales bacterium]|nr:nitronate monooxygenase [Chlamydiia bacterium]MCP5507903.1 nitronate monooxygenase [Chlamydiales bacterium]